MDALTCWCARRRRRFSAAFRAFSSASRAFSFSASSSSCAAASIAALLKKRSSQLNSSSPTHAMNPNSPPSPSPSPPRPMKLTLSRRPRSRPARFLLFIPNRRCCFGLGLINLYAKDGPLSYSALRSAGEEKLDHISHTFLLHLIISPLAPEIDGWDRRNWIARFLVSGRYFTSAGF